jgi:Predicted nucleotide-binding protein containing TIR-like domain
MHTTTIFVGSSGEAKAQAKVLIRDLASSSITFLPWWETFTPGHLLLDDLADIRGKATAALLLFTPDISAKVRTSKVALPNQNVLFELGYFFSAFDASRIALVRYGATYIPKDLDGYTHIRGSQFFKSGASTTIGKKTKEDFGKWAKQLAKSAKKNPSDEDARFSLIDSLADDIEKQFLILMHEKGNEVSRFASYVYERPDGAGTGCLGVSGRGNRLEGTSLIRITGNGTYWSLTDEGHRFAAWLILKHRRCTYFWSSFGTWGTPIPGGSAENYLKERSGEKNPTGQAPLQTPAHVAPTAGALAAAPFTASTVLRVNSDTPHVTVISSDGKPVANAVVLAIAVNNTTKQAVTDGAGCAVLTITAGRSYQLLIAHPNFPGAVVRSWDSKEDITVTLSATENTGSILCAEGTGNIPGLQGRLNPILDAGKRMYLYGDNIAIDGGKPQPSPFEINVPFKLEDCDGVAMEVRVLHIQGRTSLLQFVRPRSGDLRQIVAQPGS